MTAAPILVRDEFVMSLDDIPSEQAQLDALASEICRQILEVQADLARYHEAKAAEIARIEMRYASFTDRLARRIEELETFGRAVAERADFGPKAKSRKVGFGSYGRRHVPERVQIVDKKAALDWCRGNEERAALIKARVVEDLHVRDVAELVSGFMRAYGGEIPPGFEHQEAHEICFIKPEAPAP